MKVQASGLRQVRHIRGAVVAAVALALAVTVALANTPTGRPRLTTQTTPPAGSQRAVYHLTPASGWLSDPQRPVFAGGKTSL